MKNKTFVQLTKSECQYLLELIQDMDYNTKYTEHQRKYTVPKLSKIIQNPNNTRLAYQDVEYLLELLEDDPVELETKLQTRAKLLDIQALQTARFQAEQEIESQRHQRRAKRLQIS